METALLAMMGAMLAMMTGLLAMMARMFLKIVDLSGRIGRVEAMLETWLRYTHDRNTASRWCLCPQRSINPAPYQ